MSESVKIMIKVKSYDECVKLDPEFFRNNSERVERYKESLCGNVYQCLLKHDQYQVPYGFMTYYMPKKFADRCNEDGKVLDVDNAIKRVRGLFNELAVDGKVGGTDQVAFDLDMKIIEEYASL